MKKLLFCLLCFCLMTFGSSAKIIEVAPAGAWGVLGISGGGAVAAGGGDFCDDKGSFLACEDFEGSSDCGNDGLNRQNCNETWIIVDETGTADPDFAGAAFEPTEKTGTYSLLVPDPGASGQNKIKFDFTAYNEIWVAFMWDVTNVNDVAANTFRFRDTADNDVVQIEWDYFGDLWVPEDYGFTPSTKLEGVALVGLHYVMLRYKGEVSGGDGEMEIWVTDVPGNGWGTPVSSVDGDDAGNDARYWIINNYFAHSVDFKIDNVVVDDAAINISNFQ